MRTAHLKSAAVSSPFPIQIFFSKNGRLRTAVLSEEEDSHHPSKGKEQRDDLRFFTPFFGCPDRNKTSTFMGDSQSYFLMLENRRKSPLSFTYNLPKIFRFFSSRFRSFCWRTFPTFSSPGKLDTGKSRLPSNIKQLHRESPSLRPSVPESFPSFPHPPFSTLYINIIISISFI